MFRSGYEYSQAKFLTLLAKLIMTPGGTVYSEFFETLHCLTHIDLGGS